MGMSPFPGFLFFNFYAHHWFPGFVQSESVEFSKLSLNSTHSTWYDRVPLSLIYLFLYLREAPCRTMGHSVWPSHTAVSFFSLFIHLFFSFLLGIASNFIPNTGLLQSHCQHVIQPLHSMTYWNEINKYYPTWYTVLEHKLCHTGWYWKISRPSIQLWISMPASQPDAANKSTFQHHSPGPPSLTQYISL